jgi:hypothetical protein
MSRVVIFIIIIIIIINQLCKGIYNNMHERNRVSRLCNVAAILWLQFIIITWKEAILA